MVDFDFGVHKNQPTLLQMVPSGLLTGLASPYMAGGREAREAGGNILLPDPAGAWQFAHSSKRTAGAKL